MNLNCSCLAWHVGLAHAVWIWGEGYHSWDTTQLKLEANLFLGTMAPKNPLLFFAILHPVLVLDTVEFPTLISFVPWIQKEEIRQLDLVLIFCRFTWYLPAEGERDVRRYENYGF